MSVLYIVMPIAFLLAAVAVMAFIWAAREGQFDDLDTPSLRVVTDDDTPPGRARSVAQTLPSDHAQPVPNASKKSSRSSTSTVVSRL